MRKAMTTTAVESTIDLLCERFPKAFARFEQRRQPLKIGIHRDVLAALEVPEKDLARALRIYVSNPIAIGCVSAQPALTSMATLQASSLPIRSPTYSPGPNR
jgi:sRNA-binding protein